MAAEVEISLSSMPESMSKESSKSTELVDIIWNFYRNGTHTDVTFRIKCGDDWIVQKSHKLVLSMWSPVFADMFYGPNAIKEDTVLITDVTPQVFTTMIKFAYGSVCDLTRQRTRNDVSFQVKMFKASQSYQIEHLEMICRNNLCAIIPDVHNVFQLLDACRLIGAEETAEGKTETAEQRQMRACVELLESHTREVLANMELSDVTRDMMMTFLDLKRVSFTTEYELVMWAFAWCKSEEVKLGNTRRFRSIVDDVLGHVDLTAMQAKEFAELLKNHENVFSESECYRIFRNIVDPGSCDPPEWAQIINREYRRLV